VSDDRQQPRTADLQKVLEISRSLAAAGDLDELLRLIVDRGMELLDAERASIFLYDRQTNELVSRVAAGVEEIRMPAGRGISGATVQGGQTIVVPDVRADPRWNPDVDRRTGFHTRNILSVPLRDFGGELVGVLQVINKRRGGFGDYDVMLAETMAAQAGVAVQRARLIQHYMEKLEMQRAMSIARDIQQGLLPQENPQLPGFDIAGFMQPADETGGDIYDFLPLPDGRLLILIADATGHGIGAALIVAQTRAMLRAMILRSGQPSGILGAVNDLLADDLGGGRFVTCFLGLLDPAASALTYASAGHGPLLFYKASTDEYRQAPATDLPLGVMPDSEYADLERVDLSAGDLAAITTDGFFEATDPAGKQFGIDRVCELLRRDRELSAERIIANLHQAVGEFTQNRPQADDLTAVVIRKT